MNWLLADGLWAPALQICACNGGKGVVWRGLWRFRRVQALGGGQRCPRTSLSSSLFAEFSLGRWSHQEPGDGQGLQMCCPDPVAESPCPRVRGLDQWRRLVSTWGLCRETHKVLNRSDSRALDIHTNHSFSEMLGTKSVSGYRVLIDFGMFA